MCETVQSYRVGLLGFGRVLRAFIEHYLKNKEYIAKKFGFELNFITIADSRSFIEGDFDISKVIIKKKETGYVGDIVNDPIEKFLSTINEKQLDILIDGLPGSRCDPGISLPVLVEALKNGSNLICANKSPLVFRGDELFELAKQRDLYIGISATTAGALPSAGIINNELIGADIYQIRGILNGTSNYVLDKIMFSSMSKIQAIQEAIRIGIAEPDYRFDLEGIDTCYKTIILGLLLTGKCAELRTTYCRGIMDLNEEEIIRIAKEHKVVRLIGFLSINNGNPIVSVQPEVLEKDDPLYGVYGANKGITFRTRYMGDLTVIGGASGLVAIGATIMKDIINFHRTRKK
jgi:homoserine dehydrogenase